MSQNVELIKAIYAAYAKGDLASIMSHMADDVQWTSEGVKAMSWAGSWKGKQNAAAFGRYKAKVRKTGKHVDTPVAHYFRLKDGKVAEYRNFTNTAAIVEAMS